MDPFLSKYLIPERRKIINKGIAVSGSDLCVTFAETSRITQLPPETFVISWNIKMFRIYFLSFYIKFGFLALETQLIGGLQS